MSFASHRTIRRRRGGEFRASAATRGRAAAARPRGRRDERRGRDRENDDVPDVDARERRDGRARGDDAREDDITREAALTADWHSIHATKLAAHETALGELRTSVRHGQVRKRYF